MNQSYPVPPPELVQQWQRTAPHILNDREHYHYITLCAAQWGADQELEACCEWLEKNTDCYITIEYLRDARRPKPPSLKERALESLEGLTLPEDAFETIRCALEQLPDAL